MLDQGYAGYAVARHYNAADTKEKRGENDGEVNRGDERGAKGV